MTDFRDWTDPVTPGLFRLTGSGVTLVTTGSQAIALRASTPAKVVMVKARETNVGTVYLGAANVTANETTTTGGLQMDPGDMLTFAELDLSEVFINGALGDGVSYAWWA